ncbi:MAG: zinc-ribbon domain-containing protein [Planctomycetaceae bacterium]|nr:MAG: zinc-ribbon domain-containing protein [Planctomycetaceae bacterium]
MIIWGSTTKELTVESTTFYCPNCRETTDCDHLRVASYFTLYFIPLFQTATLGEYVRCDDCEREFDVKALSLTKQQIDAMNRPWSCGECGNSNPPAQNRCLKCKCYREDDPVDNIFEE